MVDRFGEVLYVEVRGRWARFGADEDGARAGPVAGLDVVLYVANHPGGGEVDGVLASGAAKHSGSGLAAGTLDGVGGDRPFGMVGSVLQAVQGGPVGVEHSLELVVHTGYLRLAEVSAGHPGLVRDEHEPISSFT